MEKLASAKEIQKKVQRLAKEIVRDFGEEEIVMVVLLKGALYFGADLSREIQKLRKTSALYLETLRVSSYGHQRTSSGVVKINYDVEFSLENRNVLLVDDVADTCQTLAEVLKFLKIKKPKKIKICVLV